MTRLVSVKPLIKEWEFYQDVFRKHITTNVSDRADIVFFNQVEVPFNDIQVDIHNLTRKHET